MRIREKIDYAIALALSLWIIVWSPRVPKPCPGCGRRHDSEQCCDAECSDCHPAAGAIIQHVQ